VCSWITAALSDFLRRISGGTLGRDGFGGKVTDAKLNLTDGAATALNKSLATDKKKPMEGGAFGTASTSTVPSAVEVTGGTAALQLATSSATKLGAHGVRADHGGVRPVAPATADLATATLTFPVTSGNMSPAGTSGVITASGGVILQKTDPVSPACDAADKHPVGTAFTTSNLRADQAQKILLIDGQPGFGTPPVTGPITPIGGVIPNTPLADMVVTGATADPAARTIVVTETATTSAAGTLGLNTIFGSSAEGCGVAATDFATGDLLGTLTVSVTTH
jgi:hypothetical protein